MRLTANVIMNDDNSYSHLELSVESQFEKFASGDFCTDWYNLLKYYYHNYTATDGIFSSKDFNNFVHKNELFESRFVYFDNKEIQTISKHPTEMSQEIFVPKGFSGNWNDYKATLKL